MARVYRVGVVSDTHLGSNAAALPAGLVRGLAGVDLILHAGDIVAMPALKLLDTIAPVHAVCGNSDGRDVAEALPVSRVVTVGIWNIGLVHGQGGAIGLADRAVSVFDGRDVHAVVFGHSHEPWEDVRRGILRLNPGSATRPMFTDTPSFGILTLGDAIQSAVVSFSV